MTVEDDIFAALTAIDESRRKLASTDPACARDLGDIIATVAVSLAEVHHAPGRPAGPPDRDAIAFSGPHPGHRA